MVEVHEVPKVRGKIDWWRFNIEDPISNRHDSNPATATPPRQGLSTKNNLIDFTKKGFPYKPIEEQDKHTV